MVIDREASFYFGEITTSTTPTTRQHYIMTPRQNHSHCNSDNAKQYNRDDKNAAIIQWVRGRQRRLVLFPGPAFSSSVGSYAIFQIRDLAEGILMDQCTNPSTFHKVWKRPRESVDQRKC